MANGLFIQHFSGLLTTQECFTTHSHSLMPEAAMQGANLPIRSNTDCLFHTKRVDDDTNLTYTNTLYMCIICVLYL